jgi:general secretion pathway protein H
MRPISRPQAPSDRVDRQAGFTLIEMVAVLAIVALLAVILMPRIPRSTSRARLESYAVQAAALLKADRTAALRQHAQVNATVDAPTRRIRSGSNGRQVQIPGDVSFTAMLPQSCNERPARSTISFFAAGTSCGGTIVLSRLGSAYEVRVNWLTGGIDVVARNAL